MEANHDIGAREVLACDESFFAALLAADHELLGTILADDFVIIDVLSARSHAGKNCSARSAPGSCGSPR